MKRISDILINEKLKLNKDTKISDAKPLIQLKEGDIVYYSDEVYNTNKIIKAKINLFELQVPKKAKKYYLLNGIRTVDGKEIETAIDGDLDDITMIIKSKYYPFEIFSTDKKLLEKIIDDNIDKEIKPIQDEIDKLQEKIDALLEKKQQKYLDGEL